MKIRKGVNKNKDFADHPYMIKKIVAHAKLPALGNICLKGFLVSKRLPLFPFYILNESFRTKTVRCFVLFNSDSHIYFV